MQFLNNVALYYSKYFITMIYPESNIEPLQLRQQVSS